MPGFTTDLPILGHEAGVTIKTKNHVAESTTDKRSSATVPSLSEPKSRNTKRFISGDKATNDANRRQHMCQKLVSKVVKTDSEWQRSLVLSAVVDADNYIYYVPMYVLYALEAYPSYFVAIYVNGRISERLWRLMKQLPNQRWCMEENHERGTRLKSVPSLSRFLLADDFIKQFRYAYFGDIDIAILPPNKDEPSLLDGHLDHMKEMSLPYSNVRRQVNKPLCKKDESKWRKHRVACNRITGLHFIETGPWFKATGATIKEYRGTIKKIGSADFCGKVMRVEDPFYCDEAMLYTLIEKGGLSLPTSHFRPKHGLHVHKYANPWYVSKNEVNQKEVQQFLDVAAKHEQLMTNLQILGSGSYMSTFISRIIEREGSNRPDFLTKKAKHEEEAAAEYQQTRTNK
ncbi:hypothetical protein SARC_03082 [Sphaeroforma arctica JP610]|uniref:Uncharacterized protein n=1 Tax=Sphaeroforma arctica JP610 TaxID=667725 RepID=A0A0L0G8Y9_9EUKA|nr:hypothetical protein SARC_03082 [Sphaeroforma arctica JP610]KNC84708.1 hypothetical protein SARC_03082 [Sphaeroforma arctica JP610]|eukprot:XP_014158610.1 hypothetical protein SARC_03082 [Sphaeroforma arctica JP610]